MLNKLSAVVALTLAALFVSCARPTSDSSQTAPTPVRVENKSSDSTATLLTLPAGLQNESSNLQIDLGYASDRPGAVALRSCLNTLAPEFELGRIYCGGDRAHSTPLTAAMTTQVCDGVKLADAQRTTGSGLDCNSDLQIETFQFEPALNIQQK